MPQLRDHAESDMLFGQVCYKIQEKKVILSEILKQETPARE